jgi:hypothetical protein
MARDEDIGAKWDRERLKQQRRTSFAIVKDGDNMGHTHGKGDWQQFRRDLQTALRQIEMIYEADERRGTEARAIEERIKNLESEFLLRTDDHRTVIFTVYLSLFAAGIASGCAAVIAYVILSAWMQ